MSSAIIAGQIAICQQEITACEEEIRLLKQDIEYTELAVEETGRRGRKLENNLSFRIPRIGTVENVSGRARMAGLYGPKMREDADGDKMRGLVSQVADIRRRLRMKAEDLDTLLEEEQRRLNNLNADMNDLQAQLIYWQNREREEAQAAAAAAAANDN